MIPETPSRFGIIFSAYTNCLRIFSLKTSNNNIHCLDGIRTFTLFWVIMGHGINLRHNVPLMNPFDLINFAKGRSGQMFIGSQITMDTFLFITGILTVIYLFKYWNAT